ncbi:hypothetical protein LguiB_005615 [Lonicera macranthoides]
MTTTLPLFVTPTTSTKELVHHVDEENNNTISDLYVLETKEPPSLPGRLGRFLAQKPRAAMTCDKYPKVCKSKGSNGPDCCKKKCVNVTSDRLNCGKCGKKCKYSEICCRGKCVNPSKDEKHCGSCNNKCKKGGSLVERGRIDPSDDDSNSVAAVVSEIGSHELVRLREREEV